MIVYISIGNSDDKLTQAQWCEFVQTVEESLESYPLHGVWFSRPDARWQNACWCAEIPAIAPDLRRELRQIAAEFNQDSITWAEARTEFLQPIPTIPAVSR